MPLDSRAEFGFYDAFCGIGAFHIAASDFGGVCVGACDIDRFARQTYTANFGIEPETDIHELDRLPENTHLLLAGFPCPTFSIAGKSKLLSLGRNHGLEDEKKGQLIFKVMELARESKPPVIILENVKHLLNHDNGKTLEVILAGFQKCGYRSTTGPALLDAQDFGVPQHRERVFIVLFHESMDAPIVSFPRGIGEPRPTLQDILDPPEEVAEKYTLGPGTWDTLTRHKRRHARQGNGFGYRLLDLEDSDAVSATISARYHKDGAEALVPQPGKKRPRRLTPDEVKRLMGFPEDFKFPVSDTQAYRQLGNSIVVPVARAVIRATVEALTDEHGDLPFRVVEQESQLELLTSR